MQISETELIEKYIPMVQKIAAKIFYRVPNKIEYQELVSAGILGLVDAVTKFDQKKGEDFKAYAEFRVKGAIIDELRSRDFISRHQRRKYKSYEKKRLAMESEFGRKVSIDELAKDLNLKPDDIRKTYLHVESSRHSEMNEAIYYTKGDQNVDYMEIFQTDQYLSPFKKLFYKESRERLVEAIKSLPQRTQLILSLYYEKELNFKEIGVVLELTESRVSQLHKQAIKNIKKIIDKQN